MTGLVCRLANGYSVIFAGDLSVFQMMKWYFDTYYEKDKAKNKQSQYLLLLSICYLLCMCWRLNFWSLQTMFGNVKETQIITTFSGEEIVNALLWLQEYPDVSVESL